MQEVIATAKTAEEAIEQGLKELNKEREQVQIEILETPVKGLFGIFGQKDARVRLTINDDPAQKVKEFLEQILEKMGLTGTVEATVVDTRVEAEVSGENMGMIIGRRGETLDAIQQMAQLFLNKETDQFYKVTVDTESYRKKREEALINLANGLAKKVMRTRKEVVLEPMKSYERRIIHTALQGYQKIRTHSIGEDPNRKLVVSFQFPSKEKTEE